MKLHLVFNPRSGGGKGHTIAERLAEACGTGGHAMIPYPIGASEGIDQTVARALQAARGPGNRVVVAGGDGTVRAVAHAARGSDVEIAVLPIGTFNWFARGHGIPLDPARAIELALAGEPVRVRLAEINGETFVLNASIGAYAKSIRERKRQAERFGRWRVVATLTTLKSLLTEKSAMKIRLGIDRSPEARMHATTVFVGNNATQLRGLNFPVAACLDKHKLALVVARPLVNVRVLKFLAHAIVNRISRSGHVYSTCVETLEIALDRTETDVALDGEIFALRPPFTVRPLPAALTLIKAKSG